MSEPIQSIANGTYMIGETTQTEFQAGPGISITQPYEGTVRIANDETVLFTGMLSGTNSYETLTEPVSGFKYVQVEGYTHNGPEFPWVSKTPVNESGTTYSVGFNTWRDGYAGEIDMSRFILSGDRITLMPGYAIAGSTWAGSKNVYVTRVVGINRKENA